MSYDAENYGPEEDRMTEPLSDHPNMDAPIEPPMVAIPVEPPPQLGRTPTPLEAEAFALRVMNGLNAVKFLLIPACEGMRVSVGATREVLLIERAVQHVKDAQNDLAGILFTALTEGNPK